MAVLTDQSQVQSLWHNQLRQKNCENKSKSFTLISKHLNSIHFPNSINVPVGVQASAFGK